MKLILHIGTHKTGTTSLQMMLCRLKDELQGEGILYPDAGRPKTKTGARFGHHRLAWAIRGKRGVADEKDFDALRSELQSSSATTVVLSSEDFGPCSHDEVKRIRSHFSTFDVTIIVYIRDQVDYLCAKYKQRVKTGKCHSSFSDFIQTHIEACNYSDLLASWEDAFGKENIQLRIYDKIVNVSDISTDLLGLIGYSQTLAATGSRAPLRVNTSPSDPKIQLVRYVNRLASSPLANSYIRSYLHSLRRSILHERHLGRPIIVLGKRIFQRTLVSPADADWIRNSVSGWNEHFASRYLTNSDRRYFTKEWEYCPTESSDVNASTGT